MVYVLPDEVATLRVSGITNGADRVIILWWHRNWWPLSSFICLRLRAYRLIVSSR